MKTIGYLSVLLIIYINIVDSAVRDDDKKIYIYSVDGKLIDVVSRDKEITIFPNRPIQIQLSSPSNKTNEINDTNSKPTASRPTPKPYRPYQPKPYRPPYGPQSTESKEVGPTAPTYNQIYGQNIFFIGPNNYIQVVNGEDKNKKSPPESYPTDQPGVSDSGSPIVIPPSTVRILPATVLSPLGGKFQSIHGGVNGLDYPIYLTGDIRQPDTTTVAA